MCIPNTLSFWRKIEDSALLLRVPVSIVFVWHFLEEAPKSLEDFFSLSISSRAAEIFLLTDFLGGLGSCCWVVSHVRTLDYLEGSTPFLSLPLKVQRLRHFLTSVFLVSWQKRFLRAASLFSGGIFDVAVLNNVLWLVEDKTEVK